MTFTTTALLDGGVLVEGTDSKGTDGSTVLYSERWAALQQVLAHRKAMKKFDKRTRKFFKPLTDAADEARASLQGPAEDWSTVVVTEPSKGVQGEAIDLDPDGVKLRILAAGRTDLLRWVNGELVALG